MRNSGRVRLITGEIDMPRRRKGLRGNKRIIYGRGNTIASGPTKKNSRKAIKKRRHTGIPPHDTGLEVTHRSPRYMLEP
jgi:hypothetical protein